MKKILTVFLLLLVPIKLPCAEIYTPVCNSTKKFESITYPLKKEGKFLGTEVDLHIRNLTKEPIAIFNQGQWYRRKNKNRGYRIEVGASYKLPASGFGESITYAILLDFAKNVEKFGINYNPIKIDIWGTVKEGTTVLIIPSLGLFKEPQWIGIQDYNVPAFSQKNIYIDIIDNPCKEGPAMLAVPGFSPEEEKEILEAASKILENVLKVGGSSGIEIPANPDLRKIVAQYLTG